MKAENTKGNGTKNEDTNFGCCNPKNFRKMFRNMTNCCSDQNGLDDISAVRNGMMKKMMEICCPPKSADMKPDTEFQKKK
jgi:hypothetical protein